MGSPVFRVLRMEADGSLEPCAQVSEFGGKAGTCVASSAMKEGLGQGEASSKCGVRGDVSRRAGGVSHPGALEAAADRGARHEFKRRGTV